MLFLEVLKYGTVSFINITVLIIVEKTIHL